MHSKVERKSYISFHSYSTTTSIAIFHYQHIQFTQWQIPSWFDQWKHIQYIHKATNYSATLSANHVTLGWFGQWNRTHKPFTVTDPLFTYKVTLQIFLIHFPTAVGDSTQKFFFVLFHHSEENLKLSAVQPNCSTTLHHVQHIQIIDYGNDT
jgi:hypothetical protein